MSLSDADLAALTELGTRWITARHWPSIDAVLAPPPLDPSLVDTITRDPALRAQVLADAPDFQCSGKPFGLGLHVRYDGGIDVDRHRVRVARFVVEVADRMDPYEQQIQRTTVVFRELVREDGAWRVAALFDAEDRARIAKDRELVRVALGR